MERRADREDGEVSRRFGYRRFCQGVLLAVLLASGTVAQEGPEWDLQRCIWACLAEFGPNTNPAYHACVDRRCATLEDRLEASRQPVPATPWAFGRTADGSGEFAGATAEDGQVALYYMCSRDGRSLLVLSGLEGPSATMQLVIDGQAHAVPFAGNDGFYVADAQRGSALLEALGRGRLLDVLNAGNLPVARFGLAGAAQAISGAMARCR